MPFSLLDTLGKMPIAVIDTETTGVSATHGDRVIEIGIVRVKGGAVVDEYQQLVDPGRRINPAVTTLTGISQGMVQGQPRFGDQLPRMLSMLEGSVILGHNIRFDLSFLQSEFRRLGMDWGRSLGHGVLLDTVRIARRRFGRGGNSLPVLSRRLGVVPTASHRALADAKTTAAVFEQLMQPIGGWDVRLCDAIAEQGGVIEIRDVASNAVVLPLELQEALDSGGPVLMEYLDSKGIQTQRVIRPLHVRRSGANLLLVAHCEMRHDQRTFKLERIVRLTRIEQPPPEPR